MTIWKLEALGDRRRLDAAYQRLNLTDPPVALSLSLFVVDETAGTARLEALFEDAPDPNAFLGEAGLSQGDADVMLGPLPEQDWIAMSLEGLPPVSAGRFTVHGRHDLDKIPQGQTPILIEAGQAFGTGHHGTTRGCLMAFDEMLTAGDSFERILDLGCGAGTLAIAAAETTDAVVVASDIDPVAVEVTLENAELNNLKGQIEAVTAEGFDAPEIAGRAPYDLIFANILAGPLTELARHVAQALKPGGRVILSGLLVQQEDQVREAYEQAGLAQEASESIDDWATLVMRKPAPDA